MGPPLTYSPFSRNAHDFLRLGPSVGRKEAAAPNFHARARALMVLERPSAKQPAASRPTASRRPQRPRSCLGSRFEIFSMKPAHLNNGWMTTAVDVPAASSAHSTPTPTPSPLSKPPLSRQASNAAAAQTDRVGAGTDPIGRLDEELGQLGDASGQVGEALLVGEQQVARWQCSLAAGAPPGQQLYRGRRALVGVFGRFVWFVLSYHIIT